MTVVYRIDRLHADGLAEAAPQLTDLLVRTVDDGSSVGFAAPLDPRVAREWWLGLYDALAGPDALMWVARDAGGRIVGTVQIHRGRFPNGRHRGEVNKLMVHPDTRGTGLGRRLLETAEAAAPGFGLLLLILDTETGSVAEKLYAAAGWSECGRIPDFAHNATGRLHPTTLFAKRLDGRPLGSGS
ncbi:MAG: GNAT family N-acetyltransferase [Streptomycetaceae bacterium]|nr:GNAT family N-acetyltransferase [Streptomycetaceae bacterium]